MSADPDPRKLVRDGYDLASHAYRGDEADLEISGYGHWLRRLNPRLAPGARMLDLGCGNGIPVTRELARRYATTGLDLSPVQIARARTLVPGASFVCGDMTSAEFPDGSFDAVVAFFSIINVPVDDHPPLFARIARWLVPGGWFLAVVGRDPWTGIEENWRGVSGARMYYSHADKATYERWLREAGFEIVEKGLQPEKGVPGYAVFIARRGE